MKNKLKEFFSSEKAVGAVNVLFVLSLIIRNSGIILIACAVWISYLVCAMKRTPSKAVKVIDGILIAFAVVIIGVNVYFMATAYLGRQD